MTCLAAEKKNEERKGHNGGVGYVVSKAHHHHVCCVTGPCYASLRIARLSTSFAKSALDLRLYRCFTLPNKLRAVVVSDPTTEKAAATLNVQVGACQDPPNHLGLAHFCEHMLFLGTSKYPEETTYKSFLNSHGGRSNATTSGEHTYYRFDVASEHIEPALDIFSQFFIEPLFTESATEREVNAVHSEQSKNLQLDNRRNFQLLKSKANPEHPFFKFTTGNLDTLVNWPKEQGIDVRAELLAFHKKYYSANRMTLCVVGKEDLDALQALVSEKFGSVKNSEVSPFDYKVSPYSSQILPMHLLIAPVKDMRTIKLLWPMPTQRKFYKARPANYLSHLIGHEGPGSILSKLKALQLATGLSAGTYYDATDFALFSVTIQATEKGIRLVEDVVDIVYRYIEVINEAKISKGIYEELKLTAEARFRFKGKESPLPYTISLADKLHRYPPEDLLMAGKLFEEFSPELVQSCLEHLHPANAICMITSKIFHDKTHAEEKFYRTPHIHDKPPPELIEAWKDTTKAPPAKRLLAAYNEASTEPIGYTRDLAPSLHLPAPNPFIASDFSLLEDKSSEPPTCVPLKPEIGALWFKTETHYGEPKAGFRLQLTVPQSETHCRAVVLAALYVSLVQEAVNEYAYFADLAGLTFQLTSETKCFNLLVGGYNEKLHVLLKRLLEVLADCHVTQECFDDQKERLRQRFVNWQFNRPDSHANSYQSRCLNQVVWTTDEKLAELSSVTFDETLAYGKQLVARCFPEMLLHGNIDQKLAESLFQSCIETLHSAPPAKRYQPRVVQLQPGSTYVFREKEPDPNQVNSAIKSYYQLDFPEVGTTAKLSLLSQMIKAPCFAQLRTKEQLGYIVFSGISRLNGIDGFYVTVVSNVMDPAGLNDRVEEFLTNFLTTLKSTTEEDFETQVKSLQTQLLEKDKRLSQATNRLWTEISQHRYMWDRPQVMADAVGALTLDDVVSFFSETVLNVEKRKKMVIQVFGKAHDMPDVTQETSADCVYIHHKGYQEFKRDKRFFECAV
eukprot:m.165377 g.165377  ORF g.165377 m.165377 type:complete len:1017 (+) comp24972_c0_seq1:250-3300(+)